MGGRKTELDTARGVGSSGIDGMVLNVEEEDEEGQEEEEKQMNKGDVYF